MKTFLRASLIGLALWGCKSAQDSKLDSVSFNSGEFTYLVHYDKSLSMFQLHKCRSNADLTRLLEGGGSVDQAKAQCVDSITAVTEDQFRGSISQEISSIDLADLASAKTNRLDYLKVRIEELKSNSESLNRELSSVYASVPDSNPRKMELKNLLDRARISLGDLEVERQRLVTALEAAKSDASMRMLRDIDILGTRELAGQLQQNASDSAQVFVEMLKSDVPYRLDAYRNRILVRAVQRQEPMCDKNTAVLEDRYIDQGVERVSYRCESSRALKVMLVTCPYAGYERSGDSCVFTGKDLNASSMTGLFEDICAVSADKKMLSCWGRANGLPKTMQVGMATGGSRKAAEAALASFDGQAIVGASHTACGIKGQNVSKCWGDIAGKPASGASFKVVKGGNGNYCAIKSDGGVSCWGENSAKQASAPSDLKNVTALEMSYNNACALQADGRVSCWGEYSDSFGLTPPVQVPTDLGKAVAISVSPNKRCAILENKSLRCWDKNGSLDLGGDFGSVRLVQAGFHEICAVTMDNDLRCINHASMPARYTAAPQLKGAVRIVGSPFGENFCALDGAGKASCWGSNHYVDDFSTKAPDLSGLDDLVITASGHMCGKQGNGLVRCWGNQPKSGLPTVLGPR